MNSVCEGRKIKQKKVGKEKPSCCRFYYLGTLEAEAGYGSEQKFTDTAYLVFLLEREKNCGDESFYTLRLFGEKMMIIKP